MPQLYLQSELWKAYEESAFPKLVGLINKMLSGGKQWLVGDKVSLPDALLSRYSLLVRQSALWEALRWTLMAENLSLSEWHADTQFSHSYDRRWQIICSTNWFWIHPILYLQVSLADLYLVEFLSERTRPEILRQIKADAATSGLMERVMNLPNIKKWLETRPQTKF